ncbi:MAG: hypothetical protein H0X17_12820 [Deltaproteobacteria bacterium]|nr:hypothetical protein [Deltaproteobacteria bacterium]
MKPTVCRFATLLALVVASTPALAQPGAMPPGAEEEPPPPPSEGTIVTIQPEATAQQPQPQPVMAVVAPLNESWSNVSHINGHPVKVGERGDFLVKWKQTNIATNPIGWMFGFYGVSVSHAVHKNVAIRGDANIFALDGESGYEIGASLPIYFKRVYQGPFIEPGIVVRDLDDDESCDWDGNNCMDTKTVGPEMLFGWHWTFDSGLNVAMAFGAVRNLGPKREYESGIEPAGYFRIGYAY